MNTKSHQACSRSHYRVNIAEWERLASIAGGAILVLGGLRGGALRRTLAPVVGAALLHRGISGHCYLYQTLGLCTAEADGASQGEKSSSTSGAQGDVGVAVGEGVRIYQQTRVDAPPREVYAFWRKLENLPHVMPHLNSVREQTDGVSVWTANAILGATTQWRARIVTDRPGELIAWESLPGSGVNTAGSVRFEPLEGGQATNVQLNLRFDPPLGKAGVPIAAFLGQDPERDIREGLENLREVLVTTTRQHCAGF